MIRMNKRLLGFALSLALIFGLIPFTAASAATTQNVTLNLDGKKVAFTGAQPQLIGGKIFVPYAALAAQLKATVKTDAASKKTTISLNGKSIVFTPGTVNATINGKAVKLEGAPVSKDKSVLVPVRAIGDAFGIWVSWSGSKKTVDLNRTKTVKHALGETKLNGVPQRVVILFNGMVDTSVLLGVKPVGAVESYLQQPFYEYLRPSLIGVKDLGDETQPNLEGVAALKPDLIIASKMRHEKINDQLSKIAPTVHTEDVFSWQANLKFAADVLNKQPLADAYLANWNKRVADFKKKMGSKVSQTEVSVIRTNPNGTARFYVEGFAPNILLDLGFKFPKTQTDLTQDIMNVATKEQTPLLDADYIFDFTVDWDGDGAVYKLQKEWIDNPLWKNLKAVKNKKYYKVNAVNWNLSGGPLAAQKMLDDLYFYFNLE
jgi:ABC-type Fe3+-hydroxamate transport system, periplasmic component